MHLRLLFILVGVLRVAALGVPSTDYAMHERRGISAQWINRGRVHPEAEVPIRIALAQSNVGRGQEMLMSISDPSSSSYGQHLTPHEVQQTFAPSQATTDKVIEWLSSAGITSSRVQQTNNLESLLFYAKISELEHLTQAEYFHYQHVEEGHSTIGCEEYRLPGHIQEHIDFVSPGVGLPHLSVASSQSKHKRSSSCSSNDAKTTPSFQPPDAIPKSFNLSKCPEGVFPACINALYKIPKQALCHTDNSIGIFAANASYVQDDLDLFFRLFKLDAPQGAIPKFVPINGGKQKTKIESTSDIEANVDIQTAWPLVYPQNITFFNVYPSKADLQSLGSVNLTSQAGAGFASSILFDDFLSAFDKSYCDSRTGDCGTVEVPKVLSFSVAPPEVSMPEAATRRLCNEFLKLGLQGTTVVVASGDWGVAQQPDLCLGKENKVFNPSGLASCPWVTVVGATQLDANHSLPFRESAASIAAPKVPFFTGGGFSNYFTVPQYQEKAVTDYFKKNKSPYPTYNYNGSESSIGANGGRFNRHGRAFPDVAAVGSSMFTVASGCFGLDGGTSYATPLFAGIIARLNAERLDAGKKSLGFINPSLYAHSQMLNDVVSGQGSGCGTNGFAAVQGWDPLTGLGTPKYPEMQSFFLSLP